MSNVKWPHRAYSEVVGVPVHHGKMKETNKAWLVEYEKCHTALRDCQLENSFLREDNQRLRHENAFMLRLLNEQMNKGTQP